MLSVCLSVPLRKTHFLVDWRPLVQGRIANIGLPSHFFLFSFCFNDVLRFEIVLGFLVLQTSLLLIRGELAGRGFVAVAVGVSDR